MRSSSAGTRSASTPTAQPRLALNNHDNPAQLRLALNNEDNAAPPHLAINNDNNPLGG